jgi:hypothetical protein
MVIKIVTKLSSGVKQKIIAKDVENLNLPAKSTTFITGNLSKLPVPKIKLEGEGDVFVKAPVDIESTTKGYIKVRNANNVKITDPIKTDVQNCTGEKNIGKTLKEQADEYNSEQEWHDPGLDGPGYYPDLSELPGAPPKVTHTIYGVPQYRKY